MKSINEMVNSMLDPTYSIAESNIFLEMQIRGMKPERQFAIGPYFADFFFPDIRLVLEIDGWKYHSDPNAYEHDRKRDKYMNDLGYTVVRVTASVSNENPGGVLATLKYLTDAKTYFFNSNNDIKNIYLQKMQEVLDQEDRELERQKIYKKMI